MNSYNSSVNPEALIKEWSTLAAATKNSKDYLISKETFNLKKISSIAGRCLSAYSAYFASMHEPSKLELKKVYLDLVLQTKAILLSNTLDSDQTKLLATTISKTTKKMFGAKDSEEIVKLILDPPGETPHHDDEAFPPPMFYIGTRDSANAYHGYGRLTFDNGEIYEGVWEHGKLDLNLDVGYVTRHSLSVAKPIADRIEHGDIKVKDIKTKKEGQQHLYNIFFTNMVKKLGQEWAINVPAHLPSGEKVEMEGDRVPITLARLVSSFHRFVENIKEDPERETSAGSQVFVKQQTTIENAYIAAINTNPKLGIENQLQRYLSKQPVVFATGWEEHATTLVLFDGYAAYINRGASTSENRTCVIYKLPSDPAVVERFLNNPENLKFLQGTQSPTQLPVQEEESQAFFCSKGPGSMFEQIQMEEIGTIPLSLQKSGNCTWSSAAGALQVIGMLSIAKDLYPDEVPSAKDLKVIKGLVEPFYKQFIADNRLDVIKEFLEVHREQSLSGEPRLSDQDHFRALSAILGKISKKKQHIQTEGEFLQPADKKTYLFEDVEKEIASHLSQYSYGIEDCTIKTVMDQDSKIVPLTPELAKACLIDMQIGSYIIYPGKADQLIVTFKSSPKGQIIHIPMEKYPDGYGFSLINKTESGECQSTHYRVNQLRDLNMVVDLKFPISPENDNKPPTDRPDNLSGFPRSEVQGSGGELFIGFSEFDSTSNQGKFTFFNGDIYEGPFKDGIPTGVGKIKMANGSEYEGLVVNGAPDGEGKLTGRGGLELKEGMFKKGQLHGPGKLTQKFTFSGIPFTKEYEGFFAEGVPHGAGRENYNGEIREGVWENGQFVG